MAYPSSSRIPLAMPALVRGVTAVDDEAAALGLRFESCADPDLFLLVSVADAEFMLRSLTQYLGEHKARR